MTGEASETAGLLRRAAQGDQAAWGALLVRSRDRLRRMVALRLDRRLQGRVDPSDIIQEAYLDASARLAEYARQPGCHSSGLRPSPASGSAGAPPAPPPRWRRRPRELALSRCLARGDLRRPGAQLLGHQTRPSEAAVRAEIKVRLQEALNSMDPLDREVLALRHFEQLSNAEAARVLGLQEPAAAKRYVRALKRLRLILDARPGGLGGL